MNYKCRANVSFGVLQRDVMLPGQVPVLNLKPSIHAYKQTSPLVESALEALSTVERFLVTKAVTVQGS